MNETTSARPSATWPPPDPAWANPRLPVEMIPVPLYGASACNQLPSADWDKVRRRVYALAGHVCTICGGVGSARTVEAAERWHYDDQARVATLKAITALCPSCHLSTTPGRAGWLADNDRRYVNVYEKCRWRLAKINDWPLQQVDDYIAWSFLVNDIRSRWKWTTDMGILTRYGVHSTTAGPDEVRCTSCFLLQPARCIDDRGRCSGCA